MLSTCWVCLRINILISTNMAYHVPQRIAFYDWRSWIYRIWIFTVSNRIQTQTGTVTWAVSWFVSHRKWRVQGTWSKMTLIKLCTALELRLARTDLMNMLIACRKPSKLWTNSNRRVLKVSGQLIYTYK